MPSIVLLASMTVSLLWGWPSVAALLGAGFSGLLRPIEFAGACRKHLVLPADVLHTVSYALFIIVDPKTRSRFAKQQVGRVDPPDLVALLSSTFGKLMPHEKLWPLSVASLRNRFCLVIQRLGIPNSREALGGLRPLELASLRAGGATAMMLNEEADAKMQRRGRWANTRVMSIYLQELAAISLVPRLSPASRRAIVELGASFHVVLGKVLQLQHRGVRPSKWPALFSSDASLA